MLLDEQFKCPSAHWPDCKINQTVQAADSANWETINSQEMLQMAGCVVFRVHINCFYTTGVPNLSCACGVHRFSRFLTFKRRLFEGCRLKFQFFSGVASPRSVLAAPSWRGMSSPLTSAGQIKTLIKLKPSRGADSPSLSVSHRSD